MAIVLVITRFYRPLPTPSIAGLGCCLWFSFASSCNCHSSVCFSSVSSSKISVDYDPGAPHPERVKQLWETLFSNPSQRGDARLDKRNSSHPDFRHRRNSEFLCSGDQSKPVKAGSGLVTLGRQPQSGLQWSFKGGEEIQSLCEGGQLYKAVDVLLSMEQPGFVPSVHMYRSLLKACIKRKALAQAKQVYAHIAHYGLESTGFLGEYAVTTLVKCGGLEDALKVFRRLPHRTAYSWTAVISGYTATGQGREALRMYQGMQEQCVQPTTFTFVSLIKACANIRDLEEGKRIHAEARRYRCESDLFVRTCLVDMYSKCGYIVGAQNVFDELSERDVVSWNVILAAYAQQGEGWNALKLYDQMQKECVSPDDRTFVSVFQACGMQAEKEVDVFVDQQATKLKSLETGKRLHVDACRKGYSSDVFVANTLISMYGKCGSVVDARNVFDGLSQRDVVSWNAMLAVYAQQGQAGKAWHLYEQMREDGVNPDDRTFVSVLQGCSMLVENEEPVLVEGQWTNVMSLWKVKAVHAGIRQQGYEPGVFVGNALVTLYGKCGSIVDAHNVFDGLSEQGVVSWNGMIAAYAQQSQAQRALEIYEQMQEEGVAADVWTFVSVVQACGKLAEKEELLTADGLSIKVKSLEKGKAIHSDAAMKSYSSDVFVGSTVISLYAKCGSIWDAQNVFDGISEHSVVSWNAILMAYAQHGQADKVILMYELMLERGVSPNDRTYVSMLQACSMLAEQEDHENFDGQSIKMKSLEKGKLVHADAKRKGYDLDVFVGNTLVSMYGKCGSIVDAQNMFDGLSQCSVIAWTAMLAAYAQQGQGEKSLELYEQMRVEGISPDDRTFVSVLQGCGILAERADDVIVDGAAFKLTVLGKGKEIHADALRKGYDADVFVRNTLISMYGKCGSIADALYVFDSLSQRTVAGWTAILAAHTQLGQVEKAVQLYEQMSEHSVSPNDRTFVTLLQAFGTLAEREGGPPAKAKLLQKVKLVHADAWRKGYASDVFIGTTLVSVYGKCGSIPDVQHVFDGLSKRDVVSWNGMVMAYIQHLQGEEAIQLFENMKQEGVSPNDRTFVSALQACSILADKEDDVILDGHSMRLKSLERGKAVHADARIKGYHTDVFVGNALVSMYGKCGSISDAQNVFDGLLERNVVSWNSMLAAYAQHNAAEKTLQLYDHMQQEDVSPDNRTFVSALQACGILAEEERESCVDPGLSKVQYEEIGKLIHTDARKKGYDADVFVGNTLISMYGKCGSILDAENVFAGLSQPNIVSWNAMLVAYVQHGQPDKALQLYAKLQVAQVSPDDRTFVSVLQACGILAEKGEDVEGQSLKVKCLKEGKAVHVDAWKKGYESDVFVNSTLISMYGKCGSIMDAQDVFDGLLHRSLVVWNALLSVYVEQGNGEKILHLYRQMQKDGVTPDAITLACVLQACSYTGSLDVCRELHLTILSRGEGLSPLLGNTLIHTYGRCASMGDAQIVFDALDQPNVVSWNALLAAHARQGDCSASLECYEKMLQTGVKPDEVTFLSVLYACSHAGLVDKGVECFESMSRVYGASPEIGHYVAVVDLLGRAGYFRRVEQLLSSMPMEPDLSMWLCLLGSCRKHGKVVLGRWAFDCAVSVKPQHAAAYVLMSNIYADAGLWDCAKEIKELRQKESAWKKPGQSWIDYEQEICSFVVGDHRHPQHSKLYYLLGTLRLDLKDEWHSPPVQKLNCNVEETKESLDDHQE